MKKTTTTEEATDFERQTRALQAAATITAAWVQRPDTKLGTVPDAKQAELILNMLKQFVQGIQLADDGTKFFD